MKLAEQDTVSGSAGERDALDGDLLGDDEAHAQVEIDGALVGGADVHPRDVAGAALLADDFPDEGGGVTVAAMRGVSAQAADLGVAGEHDALAAHGDEVAMMADAEVGAHLAGAWAEEAGEGEVGEGDHGGGVGCGEGDDFGVRVGRRGDGGGKDEAKAGQGFEGTEGGYCGEVLVEEPDGIVGG